MPSYPFATSYPDHLHVTPYGIQGTAVGDGGCGYVRVSLGSQASALPPERYSLVQPINWPESIRPKGPPTLWERLRRDEG